MPRAVVTLVILIALFVGRAHGQQGTEPAWEALRSGGHVALMRHATAPGVGDPPDFRLDDCSSQRTLSAEGRAEARRIGQSFRERSVRIEGIYSSLWCRCLQTAELLDLGPVTPLPLLNSVFGNRGQEAVQTQALRAWLSQQPLDGAIVLVTHQVNINALTGVSPQSGESVVVRTAAGGRLEVIGRIPAP